MSATNPLPPELTIMPAVAPTGQATAAVVASRRGGLLRPRPARRPPSAGARQQARSGWIFLALPLVLFVLFILLPLVIALVLSLTDYAIIGETRWVGVENYLRMVDDPFFWIALRNTVLYTALYVPMGLVVSLSTALLLNRGVRVARLFRTLFYVPVVSSTVATAAIWFWLLNPQYGLINAALGWVGIDGPAWLYDSQWAMVAIVMMSVWAGFGVNMIIFLAGLQGVPVELVEAARLDGAGPWRVFVHVTLPAISRTTFLVAMLLIIAAFQVFDQAYVLTKGGPGNSTLTFVYYIYDRGFGRLEMGYASALSFVLFVVIIGVSLVNSKVTNSKGDS